MIYFWKLRHELHEVQLGDKWNIQSIPKIAYDIYIVNFRGVKLIPLAIKAPGNFYPMVEEF